MTVTVTETIRRILPASVRRQAAFKAGNQLEVRASGGIVTLIPKLPPADDDYTPQQRRIIDARLAEAEKGPYHGPFKSGEELAVYLKKFKAQRRAKTTNNE